MAYPQMMPQPMMMPSPMMRYPMQSSDSGTLVLLMLFMCIIFIIVGIYIYIQTKEEDAVTNCALYTILDCNSESQCTWDDELFMCAQSPDLTPGSGSGSGSDSGSCTTTVDTACSNVANTDEITCEGAGACSFTPGPGTCTTTEISACSVANNDQGICEGTGACSFTPGPGTCSETATTSVATDATACAAVTALNDNTACAAVMTSADGAVAACSFTTGNTCTTTVNIACSNAANTDQTTCEGTGSCSFTPGPGTCSTTVIPACDLADTDRTTCEGNDACSFTESTLPDPNPGGCLENQHVENNICVDCRDGGNGVSLETRVAGDDPSGNDTECSKLSCPENWHVESGNCQMCAGEGTRLAGDDPNSDDTVCWRAKCGHKQKVSCDTTGYCECVSCQAGEEAENFDHDISPDDPTASSTICVPEQTGFSQLRSCLPGEKLEISTGTCVTCPSETYGRPLTNSDGSAQQPGPNCVHSHLLPGDIISQLGSYSGTACRRPVCTVNQELRATTNPDGYECNDCGLDGDNVQQIASLTVSGGESGGVSPDIASSNDITQCVAAPAEMDPNVMADIMERVRTLCSAANIPNAQDDGVNTEWNANERYIWMNIIYSDEGNRDNWLPNHHDLIGSLTDQTNFQVYFGNDEIKEEYTFSYIKDGKWVHPCECSNIRNDAEKANGFTNCKCAQSQYLDDTDTCKDIQSRCYNNGNYFDGVKIVEGQFWNIKDPYCNFFDSTEEIDKNEQHSEEIENRCCVGCSHKVYNIGTTSYIGDRTNHDSSNPPNYASNWFDTTSRYQPEELIYDVSGSTAPTASTTENNRDPIFHSELTRRPDAHTFEKWRKYNLTIGFNSRPYLYQPLSPTCTAIDSSTESTEICGDVTDLNTAAACEGALKPVDDHTNERACTYSNTDDINSSINWISSRDSLTLSDADPGADAVDKVNYRRATSNIFTCKRTDPKSSETIGSDSFPSLDIPTIGIVGDEPYYRVSSIKTTLDQDEYKNAWKEWKLEGIPVGSTTAVGGGWNGEGWAVKWVPRGSGGSPAVTGAPTWPHKKTVLSDGIITVGDTVQKGHLDGYQLLYSHKRLGGTGGPPEDTPPNTTGTWAPEREHTGLLETCEASESWNEVKERCRLANNGLGCHVIWKDSPVIPTCKAGVGATIAQKKQCEEVDLGDDATARSNCESIYDNDVQVCSYSENKSKSCIVTGSGADDIHPYTFYTGEKDTTCTGKGQWSGRTDDTCGATIMNEIYFSGEQYKEIYVNSYPENITLAGNRSNDEESHTTLFSRSTGKNSCVWLKNIEGGPPDQQDEVNWYNDDEPTDEQLINQCATVCSTERVVTGISSETQYECRGFTINLTGQHRGKCCLVNTWGGQGSPDVTPSPRVSQLGTSDASGRTGVQGPMELDGTQPRKSQVESRETLQPRGVKWYERVVEGAVDRRAAGLGNVVVAGQWEYGGLGESCDTVCSNQNLSCTDGDWGINSEETFRGTLSSLVTGQDPDSICTVGYSGGGGGNTPIVNVTGSCFWHSGDTDSVCSRGVDAIQRRLCKCTTIVNKDCAGTWSPCTEACEAANDRSWIETVAQSGTGAACPAAPACQPDEGACCATNSTFSPVSGACVLDTDVTNVEAANATPTDVDCQGSWSECDSACERTWTTTIPPTGTGIMCPTQAEAPYCNPGVNFDPECIFSNCMGQWSTCDSSCAESTYNIYQEAVGYGASGCHDNSWFNSQGVAPAEMRGGETRPCNPGDGLCPMSLADRGLNITWVYGEEGQTCNTACGSKGQTCTDGFWGIEDRETFISVAESALTPPPLNICHYLPAAPGINRLESATGTGYAQSYEDSAPFIKHLPETAGKADGGQCNYKSPRDGYSSCGAAADTGDRRMCKCGGRTRSKISVSGFPDNSYVAAGAPNPNGIYSLYKLTHTDGRPCGQLLSDGSYDYCKLDDDTPVNDLMWIQDASDERVTRGADAQYADWARNRWRLYNRIYDADNALGLKKTFWTLDTNNDMTGSWGFSNPGQGFLWGEGGPHTKQQVTSTSTRAQDPAVQGSERRWYVWGPRSVARETELGPGSEWSVAQDIQIVPDSDDGDGNRFGDIFDGTYITVDEVIAGN